MTEDGHLFRPIGNIDQPFAGTFDGQGFEIRDLAFVSSDDYDYAYWGLFASIASGATVSNFGIYHPYLKCTIATSVVGSIAGDNHGTVQDVYAICDEYYHENEENRISTATVSSTSGLIGQNHGTLRDSYFGGRLCAADDMGQVNPVCAINSGTISNTYYDAQIFSYGPDEYSTVIDDPGNGAQITGKTNIEIKVSNLTDSGMQGTKFYPVRNNSCGNTFYEGWITDGKYWDYPRLYSFPGKGTQDDPFIISTPAQLIHFPCSFEYYSGSHYHFKLGCCIDMSEVAYGAYVPQTRFEPIESVYMEQYYSSGQYLYRLAKYTFYYYNNYQNAYAFQGYLSGKADEHHDDNCPFYHEDLGTNCNGEELNESHIIYNLTICEPVYKYGINPNTGEYYTYGWSKNYEGKERNSYYLALIALAGNAEISDLQLIGGEIDPGSRDILFKDSKLNRVNADTNNQAVPCLYESALIGYADSSIFLSNSASWAVLSNVHTSVRLKVGTGDCVGYSIGGLVGGGYCSKIEDCSNAADFYGGYRRLSRNDSIRNEIYYYGGIAGNGGAVNITGSVNHGNIYAVCLTGDGTKSLERSTISYYSGLTVRYTDGQGNNCNNGMIFDGPVEVDENGDPVFEEPTEEGVAPRPRKASVPAGQCILTDIPGQEDLQKVALYGLGENAKNSVNLGNMYAVFGWSDTILGAGYHPDRYFNNQTSVIERCYNKADFYVFSGAETVYGIGKERETFECLNEGNISYYGGAELFYYYTSIGGIAPYSQECYNSGDVYIAPSNSVDHISSNSSYRYINAYGCGICRYNERTNNGKTINTGSVIVDLERYHYVSDKTDLYINQCGSGTGKKYENYGIIRMIPNKDDNTASITLKIAGCSCSGDSQYVPVQNCANYADILVDNTGGQHCFKTVTIYGISMARSYYDIRNDGYGNLVPYDRSAHDNINMGNFAFSGTTNNLYIYALTYTVDYGFLYNELNLGNISVAPGSIVKGYMYIYNDYIYNQYSEGYRVEDFMFGWYNGCKIPEGLQTEKYQAIFDSLDPDKKIRNDRYFRFLPHKFSDQRTGLRAFLQL